MDDDLLNPGTSSTTSNKPGVILQAWKRSTQIYQSMLDRWTPYSRWRWAGTVLLLLLFGLRILSKKWWSGVVDMTVPWRTTRWVSFVLLILLFLARVLYAQGWYIVTYALGIYHLNIFIAFLTPKLDPAMDFDDDNGPELPTRANEEFRPFIRRLPEFKFWYSMTKSTVIGFVCTFFDCFNIPVFWPILVMYFITLFYITMKRQIQHMIKYRYLPFTHSKPKYQNEESIKLPNASN